jgi:hypothetical protein
LTLRLLLVCAIISYVDAMTHRYQPRRNIMAKRSAAKKVQQVQQDDVSVINTIVEQTESTEIKLTKAQQSQVAAMETISARIRYLSGEGYEVRAIAKILNIRYQHARNVLHTPLKRKKV